ncbi:DUF5707 domain-containing protein [Streptomyces sp. NPDC087218]|uniref:DUF5707 domain-containing protein n=1 Tax=Streptomyces sp. NPDC087218 TaxID=3365769 RepID=UPI0038061AB6
MSKRILVSSLIGAAALGAVAAGGLAMASTTTAPTLKNGSARYTAPSDAAPGTLVFTVDVSDDSGVRGLKALVWPASSKLDPTEAELRSVEDATCLRTTAETSHCTYTLRITEEEAAEAATGTWYVSALATAEDGDTTFVPRAATFEVPEGPAGARR